MSYQLKILWLSDLHFSVKYGTMKERARLEIYIKQFITRVEESLNDSPFDYIFLTGDLAQAGTKDDYGCFWELMLKPLLELFISRGLYPKIITVPGNHDVNWDEGVFLEEYVKNVQVGEQMPCTSRNDFLTHERMPKFEQLFTGYREFLCTDVIAEEGGKFKAFFDLTDDPSLIPSPGYLDKRNFGYIVDVKRKTILVLLNTAWYSLGNGFNKLYAAQLVKDSLYQASKVSDEAAQKFLQDEVLKKKDILSEFGHQVTGIHLFDTTDLVKDLAKYTDYLVITTMHHPLNWLNWDEYYSYDHDNGNLNANKLKAVITKSDLLLTGHEHIPVSFLPERVFTDTMHLKSGCFLFDRQHEEINLNYSWFSVLKVDINRGFFEQQKHYYNEESGGTGNWHIRSDREFLPHKDNTYSLVPERALEIIEKVRANKDGTALLSYIQQYIKPGVVPSALTLRKHDNSFAVYAAEPADCGQLYIYARDTDFYNRINREGFFQELMEILSNLSHKVSVIRFIMPDLFIDSRVADEYKNQQNIRRATLQRWVKRADNQFDTWRHAFFDQFEQKEDKGSEECIEAFRKVSQLSMVNHIIPYWKLEQFWS